MTDTPSYQPMLAPINFYAAFERDGMSLTPYEVSLVHRALDEVACALHLRGGDIPHQVSMAVDMYLPKPTWKVRTFHPDHGTLFVLDLPELDVVKTALQELCSLAFSSRRNLSGFKYNVHGEFSGMSAHSRLRLEARSAELARKPAPC